MFPICAQHHSTLGFQSSPAPKSGCHRDITVDTDGTRWFQSSPAPKSGCHLRRSGGRQHPEGVSILTRPEERVPCGYPRQNPDDGLPVSILTRPEERVPCSSPTAMICSLSKFQSSPAPKSGCHEVASADTVRGRRVSILTRPEERVPFARNLGARHVVDHVSILTRPEERVPSAPSPSPCDNSPTFQSSPAPKSGCHLPVRT